MDKEKYIKDIKQKLDKIQWLQSEIIELTQEYLSDEISDTGILTKTGTDRLFEQVCQDSTLILDMFEGKTHIHDYSSKDYKQSKLLKIRKVLGYNI